MLTIMCTVGCGREKEERTDNMSNDVVKTFLDMMLEDEINDERSVVWSGSEASFVDDEMDSADISDGRNVMPALATYRVDMLIECSYPENYTLVESHDDILHMSDDDKVIYIAPVDYEKGVELYDNSSSYVEYTTRKLNSYQTEYFKNYKLYTGIKEINGKLLAGYVLVFDSALAERAYAIEVYGTGNMEDIRRDAFCVMNKFEVLFY